MRTAPVSGGGQDIPPLDEGVYIGRTYGLALVGHSERIGVKGNTEVQDRVVLCIEIPGHTITIEDEELVRTVAWQGKFNLHAKSGFRKVVNAIRTKDLTDEEAEKFDVSRLVGKAGVVCQFNIKHNKEKTYGNIKDFSPAIDPRTQKRYEIAEPIDTNKMFVYDVVEHLQKYEAGEEYDRANDFIVMPDWVKREVGKSDEGKKLIAAGQIKVPEKGENTGDSKPATTKQAPPAHAAPAKPSNTKAAPAPAKAKPAPAPEPEPEPADDDPL